MANGKPAFDRSELDHFFAPFAATLEGFAARRNLAVIKYYQEAPTWSLGFRHPIGEFGFGQLRLNRTPENTLTLSAAVWIDDYDSYTRRARMLPPGSAPEDDASLTARMEATLDEVLSWPLDDKFRTYEGYEQYWSSIPKSVFYSQPKWPTPTRGRSGV
jgi:hypothetical protein